ncbi:peptide ABC transporter substrate-binding protein [Sporolactobacillus sp. THM7-7]|nr:peptide ABC transporter substrate-binding protein [Sporolactobacillus sp. THM7-7]
MRHKAKWSLVMSFILALSMVLAACGGSGSNESSSSSSKDGSEKLAKNQTLTLREAADIPTVDPTQSTDTTSSNVIQMTLSGLTRMHNQKYEWDLAAGAPKVSADKKVYTFKLRDQKWSDGKPVTSQDFVYGWQRQNDPKAKPQYNFLFASVGVKNADKIQNPKDPMYGKYQNLGVKAIDDKTLEVTLDRPAPPFFYSILSQPQFMPQREDFIKKQGNKYATSPSTLLYNGPFTLSDWKKGTSWTYKKNPDYWNADTTKLETVTFKVVKDTSTAVNMYKTGELDETELSSEFVNSLKQSNPNEVKNALISGTYFLYLNQKTNKNMKNLNLRKAINAAIDRNGLTKTILNDGSAPSNFIVPKGFVTGPDGKDYRSANPNEGYPAGDASDAKKYWNQAKSELGIDSLKLTLLTPDTGTSKQVSAYVANQIKKNLPGVTVEINQQPWASYLKLNQSFKFDLAFSGWFPDYQDPMTFLDMWTTGHPQNTTGWSNKQFDSEIQSATTGTGDVKKRWNTLLNAEQTMMKQYPIVPLFQQGKTWAQKPYVKGFQFPSYGPEYDFARAYITEH